MADKAETRCSACGKKVNLTQTWNWQQDGVDSISDKTQWYCSKSCKIAGEM